MKKIWHKKSYIGKHGEEAYRERMEGLFAVSSMGVTLSKLGIGYYFGFAGGDMESFVDKSMEV